MNIFLLFYMCDFAVGLTHFYKTTVFFYIYIVITHMCPKNQSFMNVFKYVREHLCKSNRSEPNLVHIHRSFWAIRVIQKKCGNCHYKTFVSVVHDKLTLWVCQRKDIILTVVQDKLMLVILQCTIFTILWIKRPKRPKPYKIRLCKCHCCGTTPFTPTLHCC